MTRVLPLPAPAKTMSGPSACATARACGSLSSASTDRSLPKPRQSESASGSLRGCPSGVGDDCVADVARNALAMALVAGGEALVRDVHFAERDVLHVRARIEPRLDVESVPLGEIH